MATNDPRDPRNMKVPSVQESIAELSAGLGAFLTRQDSMMSEMLSAQREIINSVMVSERVVGDHLTVQRGGAGLPPPVPAGMDARARVVTAIPSAQLPAPRAETHINPSLMAVSDYRFDQGDRRTLTDFAIRADRGRFAEQSRSGLKAGVYATLAGRANEYQRELTLAGGYVLNPATGGYMDPDGNEVSAAEAAAASTGDLRGVARNLAVTSTAARAAQAWSNGAPVGRALMSALPSAALRGAGIAGVAIGVGNKALDFYQGEMAKLNENRAIYGDISVGESYGMRADEWINRNLRGRFSALGSGAYGQLYDAGQQLALKGGALDDFVGTGADIMGMGVSGTQTTQMMRMVIEAGSSLAGLAESIRLVNSAAKDAGVNAARARDIFTANYEASSDLMFGASSTIRARTAGSITAAQVGQSRAFQGINTASGFTDANQSRISAASAGITGNEMDLLRQRDPSASAAIDERYHKQVLSTVTAPDGRSVQTLVNQFIEMNGGYYTTDMQAALGDFLQSEGDIDPRIAQGLLRSIGINVSEGLALGTMGNMFTSESATQRIQADAAAARQAFTPVRIEVAGDRGRAVPLGPRWEGGARGGVFGAYGAGLNGGEPITNINQLHELARSGAVTSPAAEYLISSRSELGLDGDKTMVKVRDGDLFKVVTLNEALSTPQYLAQITDGTAMIIGGANDDVMYKPISDVVGMPQGAVPGRGGLMQSLLGTSNRAPGVEASGPGVPFEEWAKKQDDKKKDEAGDANKNPDKITLELTPRAEQLLRVMDANDPYMRSEPNYRPGDEG